jgi:hypothetical protein
LDVPLTGNVTMTGPLQAFAGSTSVAGLQIGSTGIGLSSAGGALQFLTNAVLAMYLNSGGSLFIPGLAGGGVMHAGSLGVVTAGQVQTSDLANASVTTAILASASVTTAILANDSVTTPILANASVTDAKITGIISNTKTTATTANTINTIMLRDNIGNVSIGTITATLLIGNVQGNVQGTVTGHATLDVPLSGNVAMTGTLQVPSGTASVTGLQVGAVGIGLSSSAGALQFSTNATLAMYLNSLGSLFIPGLSGGGVMHTGTLGIVTAGQVQTSDLANNSVTTAILADASVTDAKITGVISNNKTTATATNTVNTIVLRDPTTSSFAISAISFNSASTNIPIDVIALTGSGAANVGLRIAQPSGATLNSCIQLSTQSTTASGGILFGSGADVTKANMYRVATGKLKTDGEMVAQHFLCASGQPTVLVGPAAGAGSATMTINSNDNGMQITLVVAGGTANAVLFTVTFAVPFTGLRTCVVYSAANAAAATLSGNRVPFVDTSSLTTFTFFSNTAAVANGTYIYNFHVSG